MGRGEVRAGAADRDREGVQQGGPPSPRKPPDRLQQAITGNHALFSVLDTSMLRTLYKWIEGCDGTFCPFVK